MTDGRSSDLHPAQQPRPVPATNFSAAPEWSDARLSILPVFTHRQGDLAGLERSRLPGRAEANPHHPVGAELAWLHVALPGTHLAFGRPWNGPVTAVRHPAQGRPARPGAWPVQGQGPRRRSPRLRRAAGARLPQVVRQDAGRPPRRPQGVVAADPGCFGNRSGPLHVGTCCPVRSGPHGTRAAAAPRRGRPAPMASRAR